MCFKTHSFGSPLFNDYEYSFIFTTYITSFSAFFCFPLVMSECPKVHFVALRFIYMYVYNTISLFKQEQNKTKSDSSCKYQTKSTPWYQRFRMDQMSVCMYYYMSHVMRKPTFCIICENKGADQLRGRSAPLFSLHG